ncbi:glycosyltransferase family 2 protein [Bifidobacterium vespertilionis]|uniref:Glycosyltransferase n=1 Tax=Bifidobacterium vespertilionis TaxID=2562524 RepID=A0A5J5DYG8_9BIFI|nr:glycosyltransferase [Bifidobacterium vespertilionis]KAA8820753.1 glycosyltransferase [Bifidobacterium vespertilionis]KAA8821800.1 glycosyltransferase [Bifidobacterium vespertilionis]
MIDKLLSVIIPVYNAEQYISNCLDSVLSQSVELEVILVDDGSTDSSGEICRRYAREDTRVRYFEKQNGGVSSARNYGLEKILGEFVTFVDSDDAVCPGAFAEMFRAFQDDLVDIVCCGIQRLNSRGERSVFICNSDSAIAMNSSQAMSECLKRGKIGFTVYAKIFRRNLFEFNPEVRFPVGQLMEEAYILPELFKRSRRIYHIGKIGYSYYMRPNSYTTKSLTTECFAIYDTANRYEIELPLLFPGFNMNYLYSWRVTQCVNLYRTALLNQASIDKVVFDRIRHEFWRYVPTSFFGNTISMREKIVVLETISHLFIIRKKILGRI